MAQYDGETSEEIDGFRYRVLMLDPLKASDILADLGYLLAPVVGSLGGTLVKEKGDLLERAMDGFGDDDKTSIDTAIERAVTGFFDRFSKDKQRELMDLMAKQTMVIMGDGKEPRLSDMFSTHFRGRVKSMYRWFFFAIKVQFKDFFTGLDGDIGHAVQQALARVAT